MTLNKVGVRVNWCCFTHGKKQMTGSCE